MSKPPASLGTSGAWMVGAPAQFIIRLALLSPDLQMRLALVDALTPFGFEIFASDTPATLGAILGTHRVDLCVLHAGEAPEAVLTTVARLRARSTLGVIVLTEAHQSEVRIHALLTGADACVNLPLVGRELAAVILGISRRLGSVAAPGMVFGNVAAQGDADGGGDEPAGSPGQRQWLLTTDDWVLVSPSGMEIALSQGERSLIACFAESAGDIVSRDAIARALDGASRAGEGADNSTHRISMVVSRLRKKASRIGVRLPLRVVRGTGYEFCERLLRSGATCAV